MRRALPDPAAAAGTVLLATSAWLFLPREREGAAAVLPPLRIVLVDTSASALRRRSGWSEWVEEELVRQAKAAERAGEDPCAITYGADVRRTFTPYPGMRFLDESGRPAWFRELLRGPAFEAMLASRLAGALRAVLDLAKDPSRPPGRVVIVGDGTYTGQDPRPLLGELLLLGIAVERSDLPPPDRLEVAVGDLSLPREVESGAPIAADLEVFYAPGNGAPERSVRIELEHGSSSGKRSQTLDVPVPEGLTRDEDGYLSWRVRCEVGRAEEGWNRVFVGGRPRADERSIHPGWKRTSAEGFVRGRGAIAVGSTPVPFAAGAEEGIAVEPIAVQDLARSLEHLDVLVTCDVPLDQLPLEVLGSFVRRGGGWLALLGDASLPSFTAAGDAQGLLPLRPPKDRREPRDVVFLVDRSGSMAGERSENVRGAVFALMEEALPDDSVELRWFSDRLSPAIHLIGPEDAIRPPDRPTALREAADRVFSREVGGGPTALVRSLDDLAAARAKTDRESLVFLLTDGKDNTDPDPATRAPEVVERLRAARSRLVVIAAGEDADRELLSHLVVPGGRLEEVASLLDASARFQLRELFRRELNRERFREGASMKVLPARPLLEATAPQTVGRDILRAQQPERSGWPSIRKYLRGEAAPGAEVLWVSEEGDPLLAIQRVGLGMTAACAFVPDPDPPKELRAGGDLFPPLVRGLGRGMRAGGVSVRVEGDEIVVEGLPEGAPALLEARVFDEGAAAGDPPLAVIPLSPPIEGADPRRVRRGRWPPGDSGGFLGLWDEFELDRELGNIRSARVPRVEIRASDDLGFWTPIDLALVPPRLPEFLLPRSRIPSLDSFPEDLEAHPRSKRGAPRPHPAAPWILVSGMLLLAGAGFAGSFARRAV